MPIEMLSTREAAKRLGLAHHQTVIKLVERGLLQAEWNEKGTRMRISAEEIERYQHERRPAHRPRKEATMQGAIQMEFEYKDGRETTEYVILPIHEFRNSGAIFAVYDPGLRGTHLLSAGDIRTNWDNWVGELVSRESIVTTPPEGIEVY